MFLQTHVKSFNSSCRILNSLYIIPEKKLENIFFATSSAQKNNFFLGRSVREFTIYTNSKLKFMVEGGVDIGSPHSREGWV